MLQVECWHGLHLADFGAEGKAAILGILHSRRLRPCFNCLHPLSRPATTTGVSTANGEATFGSGKTAAQGWETIRADASIQYEPVVPPTEPEVPGWLQRLGDWLSEFFAPLGRFFGEAWPIFKWGLLALAIAALLYFVYRMVEPLIGRHKAAPAESENWVPEREEAMALLEDADRLASEGRFDEATHLLLLRSVSQIAAARPDWVEPSSTAREIAALPALPDGARAAFSTITQRVERSLFALRSLGAEDWHIAREAYASFALASLPMRAAEGAA